jgi:hypothetical protein
MHAAKCMRVLVFPSMTKGDMVGKYLTDNELHKYRKSEWHKYRKNVQRINGKYLTDIECLSLMASSMHKFRKIERSKATQPGKI